MDQKNVFGEPIEECSCKPKTGFNRTGKCESGPEDIGSHTVCVQVTGAFLEFSRFRGNDLSTPVPEFGFPGLREGDRWCLCAARWREAVELDAAPRVFLRSTNQLALEIVDLEDLKQFAMDLS
ncbi:MAG: DUF2237 domain-containing protein [Methylococcus sp.]|nr:MAG: DUF2237 domain-containing protein [Methylococcus sp.]